MTSDDEEMTIENKIVVSFDICSSSSIIEDLTLTNNLKALRNLLINMKEFMQKLQGFDFEIYKFTGDGWILLFPENIQGNGLMSFLILLSSFFKEELTSSIIPLLESPPKIMGLTFGIDGGKLIKIVMNENQEYIGRPLNIACRLQSAIKDKDEHPENKMLVSKHVFNRYLKSLKGYNPESVSRHLKNIRGGERYQCVMIHLPSSLVMQFPLQSESTMNRFYDSDVNGLYGFYSVKAEYYDNTPIRLPPKFNIRDFTINEGDIVQWINKGNPLTIVVRKDEIDILSKSISIDSPLWGPGLREGKYEIYIKEYPNLEHQKITVIGTVKGR